MIKNTFQKNNGYTLIEMLFYLAIFVILSLVVINALIVMTKAFRESVVQSDIVESSGIMERISREIKQGVGIGSISSSSLLLNSLDQAQVTQTVQFDLSGNNITITTGHGGAQNLNSPNISVQSLTFSSLFQTTGSAVKITLAVSSTRDSQNRVYYFYDTVVLRGGY